MSIRPMDEQKCPLDIQMSNSPLDEQKCPFVHWTNGHCLMASTLVSYPHGVRRMLNTSVSYPQGVMVDRITSLQQFWHCRSKMSIGQTEMSIGHSYVHSSNGRTEMSIGHKYMSIRPLDKQKCPLDIQIPFVHWTNGHCLMASTLAQNRESNQKGHSFDLGVRADSCLHTPASARPPCS